MDRAKWDRWCRWGVLGALLGLLLWAPLATAAMRPQDFLVVQGLAIIAALCWCARLWIGPEPRLLLPAMVWPVLVFAGYAAGRYFTADLEYVARKEWLHVLVYGLVFFTALNHLHRHKRANLVLLTLIFVATGIAGYAFYQYVASSNRVWHFTRPAQYEGRGSGTFVSPNHLAAYLEVLLPLALAYIFWGKQKVLTKVFLGYAVIWLVVGVVVSMSRAGWIASALGLGTMSVALLKQPRYRIIVVALLALAATACFIFEARTGSFKKRFMTDNPAAFGRDVSIRQSIWSGAARMWLDYPLWGVGPGHFDHRFRAYRPPDSNLQSRPGWVHNDYLNLLVDWGVAGAVPLVLAGILSAIAVWRHLAGRLIESERGSERSARNVLVIGGAAGLLSLLAHALVDYHLHVPANALLTVTVAAVVLGNLDGMHTRRSIVLGLAGRLLVSVLLLAGVVYLGQQLLLGFREWRALERAAAETQDSGRKIQALEAAFKIEPHNFETAYTLGEIHRLLSWEGIDNQEQFATNAIPWFERAMRLNPYDAYAPMRLGMCLDWLKRHDEALPYYQQAVKLDPHNAEILAFQGWHYVQADQYPAALEWFKKAYRLNWSNRFIIYYWQLVEQRLKEAPPAPAP